MRHSDDRRRTTDDRRGDRVKEYDLNAGEIPDLNQVPQKIMRKSMRLIARTVSDRIKVYIPTRSGKLRASVRSRVPADGRSATILVGNRQTWYASLIDRGVRPYRVPKKGRGRVGRMPSGRIVFVRAYINPGRPAVHFMERGATDSVRDIEGILVRLGEQELGAV